MPARPNIATPVVAWPEVASYQGNGLSVEVPWEGDANQYLGYVTINGAGAPVKISLVDPDGLAHDELVDPAQNVRNILAPGGDAVVNLVNADHTTPVTGGAGWTVRLTWGVSGAAVDAAIYKRDASYVPPPPPPPPPVNPCPPRPAWPYEADSISAHQGPYGVLRGARAP